jgi:hypothetical protein
MGWRWWIMSEDYIEFKAFGLALIMAVLIAWGVN